MYCSFTSVYMKIATEQAALTINNLKGRPKLWDHPNVMV
jgi:hypothetical protein